MFFYVDKFFRVLKFKPYTLLAFSAIHVGPMSSDISGRERERERENKTQKIKK